MFTAAFFTIARKWNGLKGPSEKDWVMKPWHVHTMELYSAVQKNKICKEKEVVSEMR